jgi:drug/metabolite transporter (DMT)-like permease
VNHFKASLLVLVGAACYGLLSTFAKLGYRQGFGPESITGSQVLFGCLGLWIISLPLFPKLKELDKRDTASLLVSGIISGLTGIFYYLSLKMLTASFAVVLLFQFTWMGLFLEWILYKKKPTPAKWIAILLVLSGSYLASAVQFDSTNLNPLGIFLGLLAAVTYALFINFSGSVANHLHPLIRSTMMVTGGMIITFIVYPPKFIINGELADGLWVWGLLIGLFGSIIPSILFMIGIPKIGTGLASILASVELPVVIIVSAVFLDEKTSLQQWIGILLILIGIMVSESKAVLWRREWRH